MSIPDYGLMLSLYSNPRTRGCTNGPSAKCDSLTLVGYIDRRRMRRDHVVVPLPKIGPFAVKDERPAVALVVRDIGGPLLSLEPVTWADDEDRWTNTGWYAAGGSFADGDSRLSELARDLTGHRFYGAISVHDQKEW